MSGLRARRRSVPRPALAVVVTGVAALGLLAVPVSSAQDVGGVQDGGWWSQRLGASATAADGVEVAWAAEAPQSVAALHIVVPSVEGEVLLVLSEVGGLATDLGGIELCRTTGTWTPADPGSWASRPALACADEPPQLGRDATALEWVGSLADLLAGAAPGDTVGIALLPVGRPPADGLPITVPFQVELAHATLRVLAGPNVPTTAAPPVTDGVVLPPDVGDPGYTPPALGSGGFDAGPLPEPPAPPTPTTIVDDPADDFVALGPVDGTSGPGRPWWRLALVTPLSLMGGWGAALTRRRLRDEPPG